MKHNPFDEPLLPNGVVVPDSVIAAQHEKRQHRQRTLRQIPVYRKASELKSWLLGVMTNAPRKYAKFFDITLSTVTEAKKCIALADVCSNVADKIDNLSFAGVLAEDALDDIFTLKAIGVISDSQQKHAKKMVQSVTAQLVAWRSSISQGLGSDTAIERKEALS